MMSGQDHYVTIEDQDVIKNAFPELVRLFEEESEQKRAAKKGKKTKGLALVKYYNSELMVL